MKEDAKGKASTKATPKDTRLERLESIHKNTRVNASLKLSEGQRIKIDSSTPNVKINPEKILGFEFVDLHDSSSDDEKLPDKKLYEAPKPKRDRTEQTHFPRKRQKLDVSDSASTSTKTMLFFSSPSRQSIKNSRPSVVQTVQVEPQVYDLADSDDESFSFDERIFDIKAQDTCKS